MNPFSPQYKPVLKLDKPTKGRSQVNAYDNGTAQQRMAAHVKPLPPAPKEGPQRVSTM